MPFGADPQVGMVSASSPGLRGEDVSNLEFAKEYQQKLNPWDVELLEKDLPEIRRERELQRRREEFNVIVVGSLLDRLPNMAGLSRTCEIFAATALTLPSHSVINDQNFRNISMTSEAWLEIIEVKPADLLTWLENKRAEGYRIIAVEQSSQSHSLQNYHFPPRMILVLGGEKEGIPAEVLHIVDDCVEIPQFGMVRSLNVHVTGSIILWEARRQRLLKD